jgi:CheY-like chemotaxis protein
MTSDLTRESTSVLLVDDERDIRELARLYLEMDGLEVNEASDGAQALQRFIELNPPPQPSVVVLDNRMPGLSGVEVAEKMLSIYPEQLIVLFSAFLDPATENAANAVGVAACVSKSDLRRLPQIIRGLTPAA